MARLFKGLNEAVSPDELCSLLYAAAFRLTGNQQYAEQLVIKSLQGNSRNFEPDAAFNRLCRCFMEENGHASSAQHTRYKGCISGHAGKTGYGGGRVQEALLHLAPRERAAVVLKDVLDLSYAEIATAISCTEKEVSAALSSGRWTLRKMVSRIAAAGRV